MRLVFPAERFRVRKGKVPSICRPLGPHPRAMRNALLRTLRTFNRLRLGRRQQRRAARAGELVDYARWVARYDTLDDASRAQLRERAARLSSRPLVSVLMPVHDPEPAWLDEAIHSVRAQLYDHWELCSADDASSERALRNILAKHAGEEPA